MSVTYTYGPGTYNHGRLSDELVAGGVTVVTVRGTTANIDVVCADGTVQATVDGIVAAHSGATPPPHDYPVLTGSTTTFVRGDGTLASPSAGSSVPAGAFFPFAGSAAPTGYLLCDGASYLRADYADLFTAIGTAWGAVDGTHFNVPDLRGRVPIGLKSTDTDFDTVGETGGAKTVTSTGSVSSHSHGAGTLAVADHGAHVHSGSADHVAHTHSVTAAGTNSAPTFTGNAVAAASTNATPDLVTSNTAGSGVSPVTTATGTVSAPVFTGSGVTSGNPSATLTHGNTGNPTTTLTHSVSGSTAADTPTYTGNSTSVVQPYATTHYVIKT